MGLFWKKPLNVIKIDAQTYIYITYIYFIIQLSIICFNNVSFDWRSCPEDMSRIPNAGLVLKHTLGGGGDYSQRHVFLYDVQHVQQLNFQLSCR